MTDRLTSFWIVEKDAVLVVDNELQPPVDGVAEVAPVLPKDCMLAEEVVCKAFVILLLFFFFQIQTDIRLSENYVQSYEEIFK